MRCQVRVLLVAACLLAPAATASADSGFFSQLPGHGGCITQDGNSNGAAADCADGRGLFGPTSVVVSPDGSSAYVAKYNGGLAVFARDPATGALTQGNSTSACFASADVECTHSGRFASDSDSAHAIAMTAGHLYTAGRDGNIVGIFDRNVSTGALTEHFGSAGCLSADGNDSDASPSCTTVATLTGTQSLAISPDGKFLYVGGYGTVGVTAFAIASNGELTELAAGDGCYVASANGACTIARYATDVYDLALSPDGKTLYAADYNDDAVTAFSRDAVTGALTPIAGTGGCVVNGGVGDSLDPCTAVRGMNGPQGLQVSPDGRFVTVGAYTDNGITVLTRSGDGTLGQAAGAAGCINETSSDGCGAARASQSVYGMQFSPDGTTLIAAAYGQASATSALAFFDVAADGTLTQRAGTRGCITDSGADSGGVSGTCAVGRGVLGPEGLALTSDGKWLYVAGSSDSGVAGFRLEHPPVCTDTRASTAWQTPVTFAIPCSDADNDPLTLTLVDGPSIGSVAFSGLTATYTPPVGTAGSPRFHVRASDGIADSGNAAVDVDIAGPPPTTGAKLPPQGFSITAKPKRDRRLPFVFTFSGKLAPGLGAPCSGTVVLTVKRGKKTVARRTTTVAATCRWKAVVKFKSRRKLGKKHRGKLVARATFGGNVALLSKTSSAVTVRYG
jgi:6-phosphogluconolactonase (cycloisomerase 2 family)